MPLFRTPPVIFPFLGHRSATRLRIGARALRSQHPRWDHDSRFAKMRALVSHFASREYAGLPVQLELRSQRLGAQLEQPLRLAHPWFIELLRGLALSVLRMYRSPLRE